MPATNRKKTEEPKVGIFWSIPNGMNKQALVIDSTSLDKAETYGRFLTHPRGHFEVWEHWKKSGPVGLAAAGLPAAIMWHEYEDFPRGRVVYHREKQRFTIYADRRLQNARFIHRLVAAFALPSTDVDVVSDEHYRTR